MPLLSALLAVHAYSAPLAGRPAVTRAAAGAITMGGNQKVVGFDDIEGIPFESRELQVQRPPIKLLSRLNEIKLLTAVSELGLLSSAEEAGVFSKLEGAGAFSLIEKTLPLVEKLGLLSVLETAKEIDAGLTITLGGFIFFFTPGTIALQACGFLPTPDNPATLLANAAVDLGTGVVGGGILALGFLCAALQDGVDPEL